MADGAGFCWGDNSQGQLGNNSTSQSNVPVAVNTSGVLSGKTVTQVSTGAFAAASAYSTCAVASGAAYCWGQGTSGQLGNSLAAQSNVPVAVTNSGVMGGTVTQISTSGVSSCAIASDVTPYCWGGAAAGQLGNNSTSQSNVPVTVANSLGFGSPTVSIGGTQATSVRYLSPTQLRAIAPAGSVGGATVTVTNPDGQSKSQTNAFTYTSSYAGPTLSSVTPNTGNITGGTSVTLSGTNIAETAQFTAISSTGAHQGGGSDDQHSCGVTADGRAYCWGENGDGQLGNGTTTNSSTPVRVTGILASKTVVQISVGGSTSCALTSDNLIYCWGGNGSAQFGNGTWTGSLTPTATTMSGALTGKTIIQITVGGDWTCALASDGSAYCWGENWNGRVGDGTTNNSPTPVAVTGGLSFISLSAMASNTCGITAQYKAYCWGGNGNGQIGNNSTTQVTAPTATDTTGVLSGVSLIDIFAQNEATCALSSLGKVFCWGGNWSGQLGNNNMGVRSLVPVAVSMAGLTATSIGAGRTQACMVTTANAVYCWGDNTYGQLGDGTTTNRAAPVQMNTSGVLSGKTPVQVSTGNYTTCVATREKTTACAGYNASGELGNNSSVNSTSLALTQAYALPYILTFGGTGAANIGYIDQNTLTASTPSHAAGAVNVSLTRSDGQSSTLTNGYTYIGAPGAPTGLTTTPASGGVTLNWAAPASNGGSAITDYFVEYSSNGGTTWNTFTHAASTATTQTVTSLTPGTTYTFRVSAVNAVGTSSPSTTAIGTPLYITLSSLPTINLNVTPDSAGRISSQANTATVSTNNANGYTLQLSTTSSSRNLTRSGGSETLTPSSGSSSSPGALATNTWGYRVDNTGSFGSGTYLETNVTSSVFTWAGVPGVSSPTTLRTTSSTASNDQTTIWYGMKAASDKPSGNYINTILYTAIVN